MLDRIIIFKKIKFYNYKFDEIYKIIEKGGYLVAPAASALTTIETNKIYHKSLINSDVAILDSGFFCILLRVFKKKRVRKLSGYFFLKKFLNLNFEHNTKFFLIDPNKKESILNKLYLKKKSISNIRCYVAPNYENGNLEDKLLLKNINQFNPKFVLINLGGERQEILASYLKNNLKKKCSIICTGAAIAFLTKSQAPINDFVDKYYLGWMMRILFNPRKHFIRALKSLLLIKFFI